MRAAAGMLDRAPRERGLQLMVPNNRSCYAPELSFRTRENSRERNLPSPVCRQSFQVGFADSISRIVFSRRDVLAVFHPQVRF